MESWLSLKVTEKPAGESSSRHFSLLISVPKKAVRLATRRNRLKRLVREAFRKSLVPAGRVYSFRVQQDPKDPGLKLDGVRAIVSKLLEEHV